ncbi:molecular chaperone [Candidatus Magnetomorum sp. HK-1]|nr:molecular chaperone [Candidatus Magnetomorum sp. HK-1]
MGKEQEMFDLFLAEANDHLETIEGELLVLEKKTEGDNKNRIDKVFRAIHSIKGSSGFMQFDKINELSHVMETLLQKMRNGEIKPEGPYIDSLLNGVDLLTIMIKDIDKSESINIEKVKKDIVNLTQSKNLKKNYISPKKNERNEKGRVKESKNESKEKENKNKTSHRIVLQNSQLDSLNNKFGFNLNETMIKNISPNHDLYILQFNLYEDKKMPTYLVNKLQKIGNIIDANIDTQAEIFIQDLRSEPLIYNVLYATLLEREMILLSMELSEDNVIQLTQNNQIITNDTCLKNETPSVESKQEGYDIELGKYEEIEQNNSSTDITMDESINNNNLPVQTEEIEIELKPISATESQSQTSQSEIVTPDLPRLMGGHSETIRVDVQILDQLMTLVGELVLVRNRQLVSIDNVEAVSVEDLDLVTSELQETIMRTRMQPIGSLLGKLPRIVRDLSKKLNKKIDIITFGNDVELDKSILETLSDPLTHLIRNCCDHGIEKPEQRIKKGKSDKGTISIQAYHEAGQINITITDDGRGIDPEIIKKKVIENGFKTEAELSDMNDKEILSFIMIPGFSTSDKVSNVSGRGVGMDVVKTSIEQFGGSLELNSSLNEGTTIHLRLPLTLAIIPSLIVEIDNMRYAIPQINLEELVSLYDNDIYTKIETAGNREVYRLRGKLLPLIRLNEILKRPEKFTDNIRAQITNQYCTNQKIGQGLKEKKLDIVVVKVGSRHFGVIVDKVHGMEEIVVKPMHSVAKKIDIYSGATVLGDGMVALILDIEGIARHAGISMSEYLQYFEKDMHASEIKNEVQSALLFKSGPGELFAVPLTLIKRIERIKLSQIERIGEKEYIVIDGIETQVLRLDNVLNVSPCIMNDDMSLLLPKHIKRPFGILLSNVEDIKSAPKKLNVDALQRDGLLGTAIIQDRITLFIDIFRLIEIAEPNWFEDRRLKTPPPEKNRHVLLVEDSKFLQQLEKRYFESDNYKVTSAMNGKEALTLLGEFNFDIIISDIEMPEMNGWEFMKTVRKNKEYDNLPSIAVTSLNTEADRVKSREAGFNAYHVKIDREALLSEMSTLLTIREKNIYTYQMDDTFDQITSNTFLRQFCTFWIGRHHYGVDILNVKEINSGVALTPIFHSPKEIRGYVNIRGHINLVIDLRKILGFESKKIDEMSRVVLLKDDIGDSFGFLVDKIGDVFIVDESEIEDKKHEEDMYNEKYEKKAMEKDLIEGVCKLDNNLLVILDAKNIYKRLLN